MEIAILTFDRLTALDAVGPYEVLRRLPDATVSIVADRVGPHRDDAGSLALVADRPLTELAEPDVVVVPGGLGVDAVMRDAVTLAWLQHAHATSRWTTSVCTGSLILGAAGLLQGLRATTHWRYRERLREFGAEPVADRVVQDGKVVTAAGVSAGIDMALRLAALVAGDDVAQAIQLGLEYDPEPPFDAGSPAKAPDHVRELVLGAYRAREERLSR